MMSIITSEQPSTGSNNVNRNQAVLVNNNNENETCNAYNDQTCECKKHMMANMNHSSKMSCLKSQDSATAHSTTSPNDGSEPSTNTNNNTNTPSSSNTAGAQQKENVFTLKRWNLVAMWSWDVECEVCAICRTPLMDSCLKCQTENKNDDCVVVWGDCNHSFHNCCMSQWIKSRNLCPLCQSEWHVQRVGR